MPVDYSSPGFMIKVVPSAKSLRLGRGLSDERIRERVLASVQGIEDRVLQFTFEDSEKEADVLTLELDNRDFYFFNTPGWSQGSDIVFQFGYPGRIFGPVTLLIDDVSGFLKLKVVCIEKTAASNVSKVRKFPVMRRWEVVKKIWEESEIPGVKYLDIGGAVEALKDEKPREWTQARQSDWQFLQRLAEKVGFEVYVEGETLHFHPKRYDQRPAKKFQYYYGNGEFIDFKLKSFKTTDRQAETEVKTWDHLNAKAESEKGSDAETKRTVLGKQSTVKKKLNDVIKVITAASTGGLLVGLVAGKKIITTPETDKGSRKKEADTHYLRSEEVEVTATATVLGDPLLKAKSIVQLEGISDRLSGLYYVEKITHNIKVGTGYRCTLQVHRNATTQSPTEGEEPLDPTNASINDKEAQPERARTTVIDEDPLVGGLRVRKELR